jgi:hypothetical protein
MYNMTSEHYAVDDSVLPLLNMYSAVEVRIDIEDTGIKLFIGPREYEWPRGCPDICAVRTDFCIPRGGPLKDDL